MTLALAVGLGLLIGLALGALGGGGSILTVPALVYLLGEPPHAAATASLIIVGVTALSGTLTHARAVTVQWKQGFTFGVLGILGSYAGSRLSAAADPQLLLFGFAVLLLLAAAAMLRRFGRDGADAPGHPPTCSSSSPRTSPPVACRTCSEASVRAAVRHRVAAAGGRRGAHLLS